MTSDVIMYDPQYVFKTVRVKVHFVKNTDFIFYLSANGTPSSEGDWEEVVLDSGEYVDHTFSNPGSCLRWKVVMDDGSVVEPLKGGFGQFLEPAIYVKVVDYEVV